jgi:ABC-type branched-subunit amino acid transport system substrate-binding protein
MSSNCFLAVMAVRKLCTRRAGAWLATGLLAAASCAQAAQIGAIVPESWPDKARGEDIRDGMLLALKTWPGQATPTLVVKDSACDARKAAAAAKDLLAAKVDVVVGGFCVLSNVPKQVRDAGVPFVSANAERFTMNTDGIIQMGEVPLSLADTIAAKLRSETGLRVTSSSACWIDFDGKMPDGYDAVLCPTLHVNGARWDDIAPAFSAAYRRPFTIAAARGYAAAQVALASLKQGKPGVKLVKAEQKEIDTVLGKFRPGEEHPPAEDTMLLTFAPKLPRMTPAQKAKLDEVLRSRACGCSQSGTCGPATAWSAMPFVVADGKVCGGKGLVVGH